MNTYNSEYLEKWTPPESYHGLSPVGDYFIYSINRDCSILEFSNWETIKETIGGENFYIFSAEHWACGWVEYLLISHNADYEIIKKCEEIIRALSDYPVLSEEKYSEKQGEAIEKYWDNAGTSERVELCQQSDCSIFSAREEYCPCSVYDYCRDSELFY